MRISGYAAVFGAQSLNLGGFREVIAPGAFRESIRNDDVVLLHGHDSTQPLARVSSGNLELREDSIGLYFEADLPDTTGGKDLHRLVSDRILKNMSFGFSIKRAQDEEWQEGPDGLLLRTLRRISLLEVSPVTWPAYPASSVKATGKALRASRQAKQSKPQSVHATRARMLKRAMESRISNSTLTACR